MVVEDKNVKPIIMMIHSTEKIRKKTKDSENEIGIHQLGTRNTRSES